MAKFHKFHAWTHTNNKIYFKFNLKSFHKHEQTIKRAKNTLKAHIWKNDFCPLRALGAKKFFFNFVPKLLQELHWCICSTILRKKVEIGQPPFCKTRFTCLTHTVHLATWATMWNVWCHIKGFHAFLKHVFAKKLWHCSAILTLLACRWFKTSSMKSISGW